MQEARQICKQKTEYSAVVTYHDHPNRRSALCDLARQGCRRTGLQRHFPLGTARKASSCAPGDMCAHARYFWKSDISRNAAAQATVSSPKARFAYFGLACGVSINPSAAGGTRRE